MSNLKLWEVESLWEKYFSSDVDERNFPQESFAEIKKKFASGYVGGVSKYQKGFFLVDEFTFEKSGDEVFSGEDRSLENSGIEEKGFEGLKKQQLVFCKNKPVYLVDNHNKALFPFLEVSKVFDKNFDVVHIDAHRDDAVFLKDITEFSEQKVSGSTEIGFDNINWCLDNSRVSDYLDLAKKTGLVRKVFNITQEGEFEGFCGAKSLPSKKFVLSLDVDVFGPEGAYVSTELKIKTIAKAWAGAEAVVLATSPGFINSEYAEGLVKVFLK